MINSVLKGLWVFFMVGLAANSIDAALADQNSCIAPIAIQPPAVLRDQQDANAWVSVVAVYTADVQAHLRCLADYLDENAESLSSNDANSIRASQSAALAELQSITESWNIAYGDFLREIAGSEN